MPLKNSITARNRLASDLKSAKTPFNRWIDVGAKFGISGGMAFRIALQEYEPKSNAIRSILGLPLSIATPACPACNVVHTSRRCPRKLTFEERCAAYDAWLTKNKKRIDNLIDKLPPLVTPK